MIARSRTSHTARWPFWLLIAAWLCANTPQPATHALLGWLAEARSFAHQQQLTRDVAHLLAGETPPPRTEHVVATRDRSAPAAPLAPTPGSAVLKKIDWADEETAVVPAYAARPFARPVETVAWAETARAAPPHEPPRESVNV